MEGHIKIEESAISSSSSSSPPTTSQSPPQETVVARPNSLNILLDNNNNQQNHNNLLPSVCAATGGESLNELQSGVEKLLQQWASSPQTPGTFLNPKHVTEEQELFANAFTQKLRELRDSNSLSSIAAAASLNNPGTFSPSPLPNIINNFPETTPCSSSLSPDFAKLLCQAAVAQQQHQQQAGLNSPILFYAPVGGTTNLPPTATSSQTINFSSSSDLTATASDHISLPIHTSDQSTTIQLPNGLKFELNANGGISSSLLNILGLASQVSGNSGQLTDALQRTLDSLTWPHMQLNTTVGSTLEGHHHHYYSNVPSPRMETDTRPSSLTNSLDQAELGRPVRPSSSISSSSSQSRPNSKDNGSYTTLNSDNTRLDPTEQYRMRLERKRARNRDAARKCRERKIRLIKSLERDVYQLSEENRSLRNRLSRTKIEIERLRLFVVDHIEKKDCPTLLNQVV